MLPKWLAILIGVLAAVALFLYIIQQLDISMKG
jgi:hypothetical protein